MPPIPQNIRHERRIAIIGAGPAGLMAAETLAKAGYKNITVYERKPSAARKFLMAGRGGLNITHSENFESFMGRYGTAVQYLRSALESFKPSDMREWCAGLGEETFIGTSGRVFPKSFKASPLLRAWIKRLSDSGVEFKMSCDWQGWNDEGNLQFDKGVEKADAVILALGGGSWAKLGSDGGWIKILEKRGIIINPLRPANSGFTVAWSEIFKNKFAGQPLKPVIATHGMQSTHSEIMISENGIEGGAIYALSAGIRDEIEKSGYANIQLDLHPDLSH